MKNTPAIELQSVSKYYDNVLAVDAVSFGIDGGSICALLVMGWAIGLLVSARFIVAGR